MRHIVRHPRLALALLLLSLLAPAAAHAQTTRPQGSWHLDSLRSDSTPAHFGQRGDTMTRERRPGTDPGDRGPGVGGGPGAEGPGMNPGTGAGGYTGRRPPRRMDEKGIARMRQTLALLQDVPRQVRIDDSTFTFSDDSGTETTWRIGAKALTELVPDGGDLETKVRWNDEALVVERKVSGGGRVKESYELGLGGTRMIVFVSVEGLMQPLARTRQYLRQ